MCTPVEFKIVPFFSTLRTQYDPPLLRTIFIIIIIIIYVLFFFSKTQRRVFIPAPEAMGNTRTTLRTMSWCKSSLNLSIFTRCCGCRGVTKKKSYTGMIPAGGFYAAKYLIQYPVTASCTSTSSTDDTDRARMYRLENVQRLDVTWCLKLLFLFFFLLPAFILADWNSCGSKYNRRNPLAVTLHHEKLVPATNYYKLCSFFFCPFRNFNKLCFYNYIRCLL